ncbi:PREDICTED: chymotrypsin-1-like [Wasmannia auropunctata]|uniref:chymotrypsin-1-like n=1 Tax=Wasmannia auropunctata TaxID=64793 RepID=UPI0005ED6A86|nr:PREDICTED: chymotrypsin-1-like [Wasmannia auropunctata]
MTDITKNNLLASDIKYDSTQKPIKLPTSPAKENDPCTIAAWGRTGRGQSVHNNLRKMDANVMLPKTCQPATTDKIGENECCTYIKRGRGTCNGDSGSGMIQTSDDMENREMVGLVSGGKPCAIGYPDVYTAVYPYISWIKEKCNIK